MRYQGVDEVIAEEFALLPGADELATLVTVEEHAASGRYDLDHRRLRADRQHAAAGDACPKSRTAGCAGCCASSGPRRGSPSRSHADWSVRRCRAFGGVRRGGSVCFYRNARATAGAAGFADETSVRIVLTPEAMVIDEARRALTDLSLFELAGDAVVMNRVMPEAALTRGPFFREQGTRADWSG